jgi:NAD(P)-dependent dehydrogenase (short-subunit alcohol dehydrogenase family)
VGGQTARRTALVTGAAAGIGAACATRLAADGADVVLMDIADTSAVRERIVAAGGRAVSTVADVASEAGWARAAAAADQFGPVEVLVSNAFTVEPAAAHELSRESWDRQLAVCLTGTYLGVSALHATLRSVVVVSSVHAMVGLPGRPAYAAAKGGLVSLARQLAVEYGPAMRVNTVLPGPIDTGAWEWVPEQDRRASAAQTVLGRFGRADEVANAVAFLASDQASYITAASLVVDGGWTAVKDSA